MAIRCRCPPENSYAVPPAVCGLQPDAGQQARHSLVERAAPQLQVRPQRFPDDVGHQPGGVQGRERVLEDHVHLAARPAQRGTARSGDVLAVEDDPAAVGVDQTEHQTSQRRLSRTGLAHQSERLARGDLQVDVDDGVDPLLHAAKEIPLRREGLRHALDLENRRLHRVTVTLGPGKRRGSPAVMCRPPPARARRRGCTAPDDRGRRR